MIKSIQLIILLLMVFSCHSNKKESKDTVLNQDQSKLKASMERGKLVYDDLCITCHLADGKGVPKAFPPLADSDYLRDNQTESIKGIKNGMSGEIVVNGITYNSVMSPMGLSDEEVADVMNFINNTWGNEIDNYITPEKVSKL